MRIVVENLPDEPVRLAGTARLSLAEAGGDLDESVVRQPVAYDLTVTKKGSSVRVEGKVEAVVEAPCSRCAQGTSIDVDRTFSAAFAAASEREGILPKELDEDHLDLDYYEGDAIDGSQLLAEQIFLGLPMKVLCNEGCKGLCPTCGVDLNHTDCDCKPDVDPRWSALKGLRDRL